MDQHKYECAIPIGSPWKLQIIIVGKVTTVIATRFQAPALLPTEHRRALALQQRHLGNSFHFLKECETISDWTSAEADRTVQISTLSYQIKHNIH